MLVPDIKPKYTPSALPVSIASVFFPTLISSSMPMLPISGDYPRYGANR
jgi:hypothetical protein